MGALAIHDRILASGCNGRNMAWGGAQRLAGTAGPSWREDGRARMLLVVSCALATPCRSC